MTWNWQSLYDAGGWLVSRPYISVLSLVLYPSGSGFYEHPT